MIGSLSVPILASLVLLFDRGGRLPTVVDGGGVESPQDLTQVSARR